jgi:hypothetical protein
MEQENLVSVVVPVALEIDGYILRHPAKLDFVYLLHYHELCGVLRDIAVRWKWSKSHFESGVFNRALPPLRYTDYSN